jgi:hypothetical protein
VAKATTTYKGLNKVLIHVNYGHGVETKHRILRKPYSFIQLTKPKPINDI